MPTDLTVLMTETEARSRTEMIRRSFDEGVASLQQALSLTEAFDEAEGWRVLGYRSLAGFLAGELGLSRSRGYQLIDEMKGRKMIARPKTGMSTTVTKTRRSLPVRSVDREHIEEIDEAAQVDPEEQQRGVARVSSGAVQAFIDAVNAIVDVGPAVIAAITDDQRRENQFTFIEARNRLDSLVGTP